VRLVLPSQCVPECDPGRKAVRKAVWPPKPTANQEAEIHAEHRDKKKTESNAF